MNFDTLKIIYSEYKEIYGKEFSLNVLLSRDKDFEKFFDYINGYNVEKMSKFINHLYTSRLRFIAMIQLQFPDYNKEEIFIELEINEAEFKKFT